ncbi:rhodanese-like domain-containing protein [Rhodococcus sp. IEGM 1366]|uniref:rhodanese-like domain-containing protein n=1 Tax=Rhodococcus sp. IEGM 1366 TaxID=3082223 RepID=UPI002954D9A1|nr:rhodanese-like domain-containing protein [Rhodococcus sp. IEGM 1366]MDV8070122.1 rhodanese-like domain-containing protein [Rhodococcus sp. IEGM 1366]
MSPQNEPALVTPVIAAAAVAGGALLIDVRSAKGRNENGAIPGAVVVDRNDLDAEFGLDSPAKHSEVNSLDQPIVAVCGSIAGSAPVAEGLLQRGFANVVHVDGGFPAWKAAGLTVAEPVSPQS